MRNFNIESKVKERKLGKQSLPLSHNTHKTFPPRFYIIKFNIYYLYENMKLVNLQNKNIKNVEEQRIRFFYPLK